MHTYDLIVIGGGAAGFFCAINYAESNLNAKILILEASNKVLSKVRISGGGRCNVTNTCSDPKELCKFYPRGELEMLGPFTRFGTQDTQHWFEERGVPLKTEQDGRVFPITDQSESIIQCFLNLCTQYDIEVITSSRVSSFHKGENEEWLVKCLMKEYKARSILVSTGGDARIWDCLEELGHTIISAVPSLFTFNIQDKLLHQLSGISVNHANLEIQDSHLKATGPLLITHWGMSGPAILRLSAWGARYLNELSYQFNLRINWVNENQDYLINLLKDHSKHSSKKSIHNQSLYNIPQRLWKYLCNKAGIDENVKYHELTHKEISQLSTILVSDIYKVNGKSTFKEEFVTAGGIDLKEIHFKSFESKICPNLYLAGEVLNIDGITGGFNFQAAWTGGWIASQSIDN